MGTIFKRNQSPYWYYEEKGVIPRVSLKVRDRKAASSMKTELDIKATRMRLGLESSEKVKAPSVERLFAEFDKKVLAGKKEKYRRQLYPCLKRLVMKYNSIPINELRYQDMEQFKTELLNVLTRKTTHNVLTANKEMFQYAVNCGYITKNPLEVIRFPSKKPTKPRVGLERITVQRAIDTTRTFEWQGYTLRPDLREKDEIYWSIMLYTGMRRNDAGCLTEEQCTVSLIQEKSVTARKVVLVDKLLKYGSKLYSIYLTKKQQDNSLVRYQKIMESFGISHTDFHAIGHTHATLLQPHYDRGQIGDLVGKSASIDSYVHQDWQHHKNVLEEIFDHSSPEGAQVCDSVLYSKVTVDKHPRNPRTS
jgi:integrase